MAIKSIRPSLVLLKDNKILVLKSHYSQGIFYLLPGGHIEGMETTQDTVIRETKEETGYDVKVSKLLYIQEWINVARDKNVVYMVFLGEIIQGDQTHLLDPCLEDGHIQGIEWKTISELKNEPFFPKDILPLLEADIKNSFTKETQMLDPDITQ